MYKKGKNVKQLRFILVAVFLGCVISWVWPVTSYGHTRMGTGTNLNSDSTPLDVTVLEIDSSDPISATVTYQVKGSGSIYNVVFTAPGQSKITAASKSGTFTFSFNQTTFPEPLGPTDNSLILKYESNGHPNTKVVPIGEKLEGNEGAMIMTLEVPDTSRSLGYDFLPITSKLHEVYDRYYYDSDATTDSRVVVLGTSVQEMIIDDAYGITMSPIVDHWYSSKSSESILPHTLPLISTDKDKNGRLHYQLLYQVDSAFTLYDELMGHSNVNNKLTNVKQNGNSIPAPISRGSINVGITP